MKVGARLEIARSEKEIEAIVPEWAKLAHRTAGTPFEHPELALSIHTLNRDHSSPWIACLVAADGTMEAVLPLRHLQGQGFLSRRQLQPLGGWHNSLFTGLASPDSPGALAQLFVQLVQRHEWDFCDLRFVPEDCELACLTGSFRTQVSRALRLTGRAGSSTLITPSRNLAIKRRKLDRRGSTTLTPAETGPCIGEAVNAFAALHTNRWQNEPAAQEFATAKGRQVLLELLTRPDAARVARIGTLRLDGKIIAAHIAFRVRERQWCWRLAHDPGYEEFSPGTLLYEGMIQDAAEAGCNRYELGRGEEAYKLKWGPETYPLYRVSVRSRSWRGRLGAFLDHTRQQSPGSMQHHADPR